MTTTCQNACNVAVQGLLEPRVLGYTDELEEEDGFEEADQADVKQEAHAAIVPDFGIRIRDRSDSELIVLRLLWFL